MLDEQGPSVQSAADRTKAVRKSEVEELHIHQNLETNHSASIFLHLKINSGFHARENFSEETMSESSQIRKLHDSINF